MEYSVYILQSCQSGRHYIGQSSNLDYRVLCHNRGLCRSTKRELPWKLVFTEKYQTRREAILRERQIKSYKSGEAFKKLL